jgi:hypothetical protein
MAALGDETGAVEHLNHALTLGFADAARMTNAIEANQFIADEDAELLIARTKKHERRLRKKKGYELKKRKEAKAKASATVEHATHAGTF